jgi:signal peptidase II
MSEAPRSRGRALAGFGLLALGVALADQLIKLRVVREMALGESRRVFGALLSLTRQSNTGAAFGMFPWASEALTVAGVVVSVVLLIWALRSAASHPEFALPLALILGGALGNLTDRVFRGEVVDYLDVHFWPVFNLADIALTIGVVWFGVRLMCCPPAPPPPAGPGEAD